MLRITLLWLFKYWMNRRPLMKILIFCFFQGGIFLVAPMSRVRRLSSLEQESKIWNKQPEPSLVSRMIFKLNFQRGFPMHLNGSILTNKKKLSAVEKVKIRKEKSNKSRYFSLARLMLSCRLCCWRTVIRLVCVSERRIQQILLMIGKQWLMRLLVKSSEWWRKKNGNRRKLKRLKVENHTEILTLPLLKSI